MFTGVYTAPNYTVYDNNLEKVDSFKNTTRECYSLFNSVTPGFNNRVYTLFKAIGVMHFVSYLTNYSNYLGVLKTEDTCISMFPNAKI